jgi:type II secretory pathway component PulM
MSDRTTKILLGAIALGLWANLFIPLIQPISAIAQYQNDYFLKSIDAHLTDMENDLGKVAALQYQTTYVLQSADSRLASIDGSLGKLQGGSCPNVKLCQ